MRRSAIVLLAWGAWLGVMTAVLLVFSGQKGPLGLHPIEYQMLGSASGACLLAGLVLLIMERREGATDRLLTLTDGSFATAALSSGLALALLGAGFGLWLILIGAGVTALGAGGLVREEIARRRVRARLGQQTVMR